MAAQTELVLQTVVKGTETATKSLNDVKGALDGIGKSAKETGDKIPSFTQKLKANEEGFKSLGIVAGIATTGIVIGIRGAVSEAVKFENAFVGLKSIAEGTGKDFQKAKVFIQDFTKDGLITAGDAATSLKSLFQRGFSLEESVVLLNRFKDSASFGRQSTLGLGEAVRGAAEGLKNENSMLVDNAGVTKNVAKMWEEYANKIGVKTNAMTLDQKREAEYQGILAETKFQVGDATKYANGYAGAVARQDAATLALQQTIGSTLMPTMTVLTTTITNILTPISEWIAQNPKLSADIILITGGVLALTTGIIALGFAIPPIIAGITAIGTVLGIIASPIVLVTGLIVALGFAMYKVVTEWESYKNAYILIWEDIKKAVSDIVGATIGYVVGQFDYMMKKIDEAINYLANKAMQARNYVSGIASAAGQKIDFGNAAYDFIHGARATGGPVSGGKTYLVGEKGPELFSPGTSGQIIPNNKIGGGGTTLVINISGMFGSDAVGEISDAIVTNLKRASYI